MRVLILLAAGTLLLADGPGVMPSRRAQADFELTANPDAPAWRGVPGVFADRGPKGEPVSLARTEIRSRWTPGNLYFLFICPYQKLNLKPQPSQTEETNRLWNYDVAEVFVGSDFQHIERYKEFEMSPQGEWVDLDINVKAPLPEGGWRWNSGFQVKARIDEARKVWYGEMRIPLRSIDPRPPEPGRELRLNLYRCQGPEPGRHYIAWQPTHSKSFHVPEAFGRIRLVSR